MVTYNFFKLNKLKILIFLILFLFWIPVIIYSKIDIQENSLLNSILAFLIIFTLTFYFIILTPSKFLFLKESHDFLPIFSNFQLFLITIIAIIWAYLISCFLDFIINKIKE